MKIIKRTGILIAFVMLSQVSFAQLDEPDPEPTPIDGGVSLLLAAGVAYGVKKYRDHRKGENVSDKG